MSISNLEYPNDINIFCQNLTASGTVTGGTVTFTTINATNVFANNIDAGQNLTIAGGSPITTYIELNLNGSLSGPWAVGPTCTLKLSKLNNRVTICQTKNASAAQNAPAAAATFSIALPLAYRPADPAIVKIPIWVFDGGVSLTSAILGTFVLDPATGIVTFNTSSTGGFSGTGAGAILPFGVTYDVSA